MRRKFLSMTQLSLALACGLGDHHQQVSRYENGTDTISASRLWQIADALETDIDFFYEGLKDQLPLHVPEQPAVFH